MDRAIYLELRHSVKECSQSTVTMEEQTQGDTYPDFILLFLLPLVLPGLLFEKQVWKPKAIEAY